MGGIVQSTVFGIPRGAQDSQKLRSHAQSVGTIKNLLVSIFLTQGGILSYLILSYPILSYPILSYPILLILFDYLYFYQNWPVSCFPFHESKVAGRDISLSPYL